MTGKNVSDIDPQDIVKQIRSIENLGGADLYCFEGYISLALTQDFDLANDGMLRFSYWDRGKNFSSQLRFFLEDQEYFIADSGRWPAQEIRVQFEDVLEALKYLPKNQIRELTPEADHYLIDMIVSGAPDDYDRVITYTKDGTDTTNAPIIHLMVQPMHKADDSGFSGNGDEVIHLFYARD